MKRAFRWDAQPLRSREADVTWDEFVDSWRKRKKQTWYCSRCGNLLYVARMSDRKRKATCSLMACDLIPLEWTEASKYAEGTPPGAIPGGDVARIADAQQRFLRVLDRWSREGAAAAHKETT